MDRKKHPMADSAGDARNSGSLFTRIVVVALCLAATGLLAWVYCYLKPATWRYYSDDMSVRALARDAVPRFILWKKAELLPGDINLPADLQEAAVSPDGTRMVFTRGLSNGDANLHMCRWNGRSWDSPRPLRALNSKFNEIGPSFGGDGNCLYFSTDRPGGQGGYDIWVARWDGAEYAWPQPLSQLVNSRFDDMSPRSSGDDGKLYFSSNRPKTLLAKEDDQLSPRDLRQKYAQSDYDIYTADKFPASYTNRAVERAMGILYSLRTGALSDRTVMEKLGGTRESEAAVDRALEWLAKNQETNGCWSIAKHGGQDGHDVAATAAALLAFYGRGERHDRQGKYQANVANGLKWLLSQQNRLTGDIRGQNFKENAMYDQGFATLALVEAYGLSKDQDLAEAAQSVVFFLADAQNDIDGGWRYQPKQPADLSVSGWIIMALKNAELSGILVPAKTLAGAKKFLKSASYGNSGGQYSYQPNNKMESAAMQASGFFCCQLMGLSPNTPKAFETAAFMRKNGVRVADVYYAYYGTLAANQNQGPLWKEWNGKLKELFLAAQDPDGSWILKEGHGAAMGRVISTALATLSLQAHYRYVPLYGLGFEPDEKSRETSSCNGDELPQMPEYDRARALEAVNSDADDVCAEPTRRGDFVYFASNRGDGYGGFDVYRAHMNGNTPQPPENLGRAVNTVANETAPSVTMAGFRLVFSSDRDADGNRFKLYLSDSKIVFQRYDYSNLPTPGWLVDNHGTSLLVLAAGMIAFIILFIRAVGKMKRMAAKPEEERVDG